MTKSAMSLSVRKSIFGVSDKVRFNSASTGTDIKISHSSGPNWSCSQDQIIFFLMIDLATGNHVSQYHL